MNQILAELDGWVLITDDPNYYPYWCNPKFNRRVNTEHAELLFEEYTRINAIYNIEQSLDETQKSKYIELLKQVCDNPLFATEKQRAQALSQLKEKT